MTKQTEAIKLVLKHAEPSFLSAGWTLVRSEGIKALREALAEQPAPITWTPEDGLRPQDIRVELYPPQPTSGMVVGMSKGVRLVHTPTGTVVECDTERSHHRNREVALKKLEAALAEQPAHPACDCGRNPHEMHRPGCAHAKSKVEYATQDQEARYRSHIENEWRKLNPEQTSQQEPLTDGFVQPVPDKCDRITWRGSYYPLPLVPPAQQELGVCGERRGACGIPCEPCEGKPDPDYVQQPAQPQQEPVAWMHEWEDGERIPMLMGRDDRNNDQPKSVRPLVYGDTSPPAQRKPLTGEEINQIEARWDASTHGSKIAFVVRETEAAHGIKENT